jgi:histone-lysine N-methyltransferase SETD3
MTFWLDQGGADHSKLELRWYYEGYRGVHAKTFIHKNECLLFIPRTHILTLEQARTGVIGGKLDVSDLVLTSPKHNLLAVYLLEETRKGADSFWQPWLDVLPKAVDSFPIFYTEEELTWLKGAQFLDQVTTKK